MSNTVVFIERVLKSFLYSLAFSSFESLLMQPMLVQWQKQRCLSDWQADPREVVVLPILLMYCFVPGGEVFCCALSTQPCVVLRMGWESSALA